MKLDGFTTMISAAATGLVAVAPYFQLQIMDAEKASISEGWTALVVMIGTLVTIWRRQAAKNRA